MDFHMNFRKQYPILTLRSGLDGKLTNLQKKICKILDYKHVTYEHSHVNKNSQGMLERKQSWVNFLKIITKDYLKYSLRNLKNNFYYYLNIRNHKVD